MTSKLAWVSFVAIETSLNSGNLCHVNIISWQADPSQYLIGCCVKKPRLARLTRSMLVVGPARETPRKKFLLHMLSA